MPVAPPAKFAVTIAPPLEYQHREAFREVAESIHFALLRLGFDSVLSDDPALPGRRHIVFGSNTFSWWNIRIPDDAILVNLEQIYPGSRWVTEELLATFRRHVVWDYSLRNIATLRALGVPDVRHVPIGHVPELERIPAVAEPDIDVLVVGSLNRHRLDPVDELRRLGVNAQARFGVYGAARDALYARAKIVLNTHFYDTKIFEAVRVSYLLINGVFVVSETCVDTEEAELFASAVAFTGYRSVVSTCLHYLGNPAERAARIETGRTLMRARPATRFVAAALAELGASAPPDRRAALDSRL
ncbi:CgeB family protein [Nocardia aurantia]|uniref:Glycosyltransferase family 1 protein n=1 Tax=Nocardia aurantia TaxID=2585199 RepID=A0A7K0DUV8_9NOCA|nr:hypothetical protein [Nocardia aurantia]MQY29162.1 hypothetical protein [Nocardia aurantia]